MRLDLGLLPRTQPPSAPAERPGGQLVAEDVGEDRAVVGEVPAVALDRDVRARFEIAPARVRDQQRAQLTRHLRGTGEADVADRQRRHPFGLGSTDFDAGSGEPQVFGVVVGLLDGLHRPRIPRVCRAATSAKLDQPG